MTTAEKIAQIRQRAASPMGDRLISQLQYALVLGQTGEDQEVLLVTDQAATQALEEAERDGVLTDTAARRAEQTLSAISQKAKRLRLICVAHSHIDVNWMWSYPETVACTLSTFQTMLRLMEEYPDFHFSQSQTALYEICRQYRPDLFEQIKARVKEGRWEVSASTWVECDKNMPSGESLVRQLLYTKTYFREQFGLPSQSLALDFEPDTFGHSANLPEILSAGGVRYYYHCRGDERTNLYRWRGLSGAEVLCYREPNWYNAEIDGDMALYLPGFCRESGVDRDLKVYGVGDHGGGPSRRDIERLMDMAAWPVYPTLQFGTYKDFFTYLEPLRSQFPLVEGELGPVFTGCYSTQTRIKRANRRLEAKLCEAETFQALAAAVCGDAPHSLRPAWEQVLTQQFHDVITGSCVESSRNYALGEFQRAQAQADTEGSRALERLAEQIDTAALEVPAAPAEDRSQGAGVGFGVQDYCLPQTERGGGLRRLYHVFQSHPQAGEQLCSLLLWDWPGDPKRITLTDAQGFSVPCQVIEKDRNGLWENYYWGHDYLRLLAKVSLPACGYTTLVLDQAPRETVEIFRFREPRVERIAEYRLENERILARFDSQTALLVELRDKCTGENLLGDPGKGGFRLIEEDDSKGMTAWVVGRYLSERGLQEQVKITEYLQGPLRSWLSYRVEFGRSSLAVTVSLDTGAGALEFRVDCDWQETPVRGASMPQLCYTLPLAKPCEAYLSDIPCGVIRRLPKAQNIPANSFLAGSGLALTSVGGHGFRGDGQSLSLTLVRSSYDPDPYPDQGIHSFRFLAGLEETPARLLERSARSLCPPTALSGTRHPGKLPPAGQLLRAEGAVVSAVKPLERENGLLVRLYPTEEGTVTIEAPFPVREARQVDLLEEDAPEEPIRVAGSSASFQALPFRLYSVALTW